MKIEYILSIFLLFTVDCARGLQCSNTQKNPCENGGTCYLQSGSLLQKSKQDESSSRLWSCSCPTGLGLETCLPSNLSRISRPEPGEGLRLAPRAGHVVVVDYVAPVETPQGRDTLPLVVYWCQGARGCSLPPSLVAPLEVRWHEEPEYTSREIPCPLYNVGANIRKFIPTESTCYLKTKLTGSWSQAREQCQNWGGDLAFPLPATNSTPHSWMQDREDVWLAGSTSLPSRPWIPLDSSLFEVGIYKACFSDLWRCSDQIPELDEFCVNSTCSKSLRGLCALPPRRTPPPAPSCVPALHSGVSWVSTQPGLVARQPCPAPQSGFAEWSCNLDGSWSLEGPDLSSCSTLQGILGSSLNQTLVLEGVRANLEKIGTGDIPVLLDFLYNTSTAENNTKTSSGESSVLLRRSVETLTSLIAVPDLWLGLPASNLLSQVDKLQDTVDNIGARLISAENKTIVEPGGDVQIAVGSVNQTAPATFQDEGSTISVQLDSVSHSMPVVFKSFRKLGCIINRQVSCEQPRLTKPQVNSNIIGANLGSGQGLTNVSVRIVFSHTHTGDRYTLSSVKCVYWDSRTRDWEGAGCTLESHTPTHSTCSCDHLTNFAVIMDLSGIVQQSELAPVLNMISVICLPLSLAGLLLSLLTFLVIPGLRSVRNSIHVNLCLSLLVAHTLTLTALQATEPKILCQIVAICLHFFYLSSFCWMLVEGGHVYSLLIDVFQRKQIGLVYYCGVGYGVPVLIVGISILCSHLLDLEGYGGESFCWLNPQHGFIWAFGAPVAVILLTNLVIFSLAMLVSRRAITRNTNIDQKARFLSWLKGSSSLISILGISWIFGFLYSYKGAEWMAVIFTLVNSLQGVCIFLMHVVFNQQVRKKTKEYLSRQLKNVEYSTSHSRTSTRRGTHKKLDRNESETTFVDYNLNSTNSTSNSGIVELRSQEGENQTADSERISSDPLHSMDNGHPSDTERIHSEPVMETEIEPNDSQDFKRK